MWKAVAVLVAYGRHTRDLPRVFFSAMMCHQPAWHSCSTDVLYAMLMAYTSPLCKILRSLSLSSDSSKINGWVEGTDAIIALVNGKQSWNCPSSLVAAPDLSTSAWTQAGHQPVNTSWSNCSRNALVPGSKIKTTLSLLPLFRKKKETGFIRSDGDRTSYLLNNLLIILHSVYIEKFHLDCAHTAQFNCSLGTCCSQHVAVHTRHRVFFPIALQDFWSISDRFCRFFSDYKSGFI